MSLAHIGYVDDQSSFPRVSGDEPATLKVEGGSVWFSPRERG